MQVFHGCTLTGSKNSCKSVAKNLELYSAQREEIRKGVIDFEIYLLKINV